MGIRSRSRPFSVWGQTTALPLPSRYMVRTIHPIKADRVMLALGSMSSFRASPSNTLRSPSVLLRSRWMLIEPMARAMASTPAMISGFWARLV